MGVWNDYVGIASNGDPDYKNNILLHTKNPFTKNEENSDPYAVYYTLYTAVADKLVEEDPASSDWESSKTQKSTKKTSDCNIYVFSASAFSRFYLCSIY